MSLPFIKKYKAEQEAAKQYSDIQKNEKEQDSLEQRVEKNKDMRNARERRYNLYADSFAELKPEIRNKKEAAIQAAENYEYSTSRLPTILKRISSQPKKSSLPTLSSEVILSTKSKTPSPGKNRSSKMRTPSPGKNVPARTKTPSKRNPLYELPPLASRRKTPSANPLPKGGKRKTQKQRRR